VVLGSAYLLPALSVAGASLEAVSNSPEFETCHRPVPYCRRRRGNSRIALPTAIVSMFVTSPRISKSITLTVRRVVQKCKRSGGSSANRKSLTSPKAPKCSATFQAAPSVITPLIGPGRTEADETFVLRLQQDDKLAVDAAEKQRTWDLNAELVTLSACETALGRDAGGEGFLGFTQALLMSGTRSVCLSLWKVDDTATALLMQRFYANLLGRRPGLSSPMPKAESLREANAWLRDLKRAEVLALAAAPSGGVERSKGARARTPAEIAAAIPAGEDGDQPYASPHFWAAFVLSGDPD
jgi:CHAT domain-containing protein